MKFKLKKAIDREIPFNILVPGDVFKYGDDLFMKTEEGTLNPDNKGDNAVNLLNGELYCFDYFVDFHDGTTVEPEMVELYEVEVEDE